MSENFSVTKKMVLVALFVAIGCIVSLFEFPIFPLAPMLKLDFSFSILLIGGYVLGIKYSVIMCFLLQVIRLIITSSVGVGELANIIVSMCFVVVPVIIYKYKKGIKWVLVGLSVGIILQITVSFLCNLLFIFPFYGMTVKGLEVYIILFNLIKASINSIITFILYKKISKILHKFF